MPAAWAGVGVGLLGAYGASQGPEASKSSGQSGGYTTSKKASELNLGDKLTRDLIAKLSGGMSERVVGQKPVDEAASAAKAQGVVQSIFDTYQKTALPKIADMGNRGGSYDNTTHQLIANDAFAQANAKASEVVLNTIQKDKELKNQQDALELNALIASLGLGQQGTQSSKSKGRENQLGTSTGTSLAGGENWATGLASGIQTGVGTYGAIKSAQ